MMTKIERNYVSMRILEDETFIRRIPWLGRNRVKARKKATACLAVTSAAFLSFIRHRVHILGAHVRHTPRVQSLLPARLPSSSQPPFPSRSARVSSLARSIGLPTGATPIPTSYTRSYTPSFLSSFILLSLSLLSRGFVYFAVLLE